ARVPSGPGQYRADGGEGYLDQDVAGVRSEVELARGFQAVLAEAHVRHAREDGKLQRVDRRRLAQVVGAVDRQRVLQREDAEAVAGGVQQGEAADAVAFLAHASLSWASRSSAMARARACSSDSSSGATSSGSMRTISSSASSTTSSGVGSGRLLCRLAARSRSCCTDRHTSRKRCIGARKRYTPLSSLAKPSWVRRRMTFSSSSSWLVTSACRQRALYCSSTGLSSSRPRLPPSSTASGSRPWSARCSTRMKVNSARRWAVLFTWAPICSGTK